MTFRGHRVTTLEGSPSQWFTAINQQKSTCIHLFLVKTNFFRKSPLTCSLRPQRTDCSSASWLSLSLIGRWLNPRLWLAVHRYFSQSRILKRIIEAGDVPGLADAAGQALSEIFYLSKHNDEAKYSFIYEIWNRSISLIERFQTHRL